MEEWERLALERSTNWVGAGRVKLDRLKFLDRVQGKMVRPLDPNNVTRLINVFKLEGLKRFEPQNYIAAIAPPALRQYATLQRRGGGKPPLINFPEDLKIKCLFGRHRVAAAQESQLSERERWWTVDFFISPSDAFSWHLASEDSNSLKFSDGYIFRNLRLFHGKPEEKKWLAKLTPGKKRDYVQLIQSQYSRLLKALEELLPFEGLWGPFLLGSFHRILSLKCIPELENYLAHVKYVWTAFLNGLIDPGDLDADSVNSLELLFPSLSNHDHDTIRKLMDSGAIFPRLKRGDLREVLLRRIQCGDRIPSLRTFFQDTIYLGPCARVMRKLISGKLAPEEHIRCKLSEMYMGAEADFNLRYQELWLFAIRNFPELVNSAPRKVPGRPTPVVKEPSPMLWQNFAGEAERLGFRSKAITTLQRHDVLTTEIRAFLLKLYHRVGDDDLSKSVTAIAKVLPKCNVGVQRRQGRASVTNDFADVPVDHRCGRPFEDDFERDRHFCYTEHICTSGGTPRLYISSFAIARAIFHAFFGATVLGTKNPIYKEYNSGPPPQDLDTVMHDLDHESFPHDAVHQIDLVMTEHSSSRQEHGPFPGIIQESGTAAALTQTTTDLTPACAVQPSVSLPTTSSPGPRTDPTLITELPTTMLLNIQPLRTSPVPKSPQINAPLPNAPPLNTQPLGSPQAPPLSTSPVFPSSSAAAAASSPTTAASAEVPQITAPPPKAPTSSYSPIQTPYPATVQDDFNEPGKPSKPYRKYSGFRGRRRSASPGPKRSYRSRSYVDQANSTVSFVPGTSPLDASMAGVSQERPRPFSDTPMADASRGNLRLESEASMADSSPEHESDIFDEAMSDTHRQSAVEGVAVDTSDHQLLTLTNDSDSDTSYGMSQGDNTIIGQSLTPFSWEKDHSLDATDNKYALVRYGVQPVVHQFPQDPLPATPEIFSQRQSSPARPTSISQQPTSMPQQPTSMSQQPTPMPQQPTSTSQQSTSVSQLSTQQDPTYLSSGPSQSGVAQPSTHLPFSFVGPTINTQSKSKPYISQKLLVHTTTDHDSEGGSIWHDQSHHKLGPKQIATPAIFTLPASGKRPLEAGPGSNTVPSKRPHDSDEFAVSINGKHLMDTKHQRLNDGESVEGEIDYMKESTEMVLRTIVMMFVYTLKDPSSLSYPFFTVLLITKAPNISFKAFFVQNKNVDFDTTLLSRWQYKYWCLDRLGSLRRTEVKNIAPKVMPMAFALEDDRPLDLWRDVLRHFPLRGRLWEPEQLTSEEEILIEALLKHLEGNQIPFNEVGKTFADKSQVLPIDWEQLDENEEL